MTDREQLEAMLTRVGIAFRVDAEPTTCRLDWARVEHGIETRDVPAASVLEVHEGSYGEGGSTAAPRNTGYQGFFTRIGFDDDGMIVWWGAWE